MERQAARRPIPIFLWKYVPSSLSDVLTDLTREILRQQPEDIHLFAAEYFEKAHALQMKLSPSSRVESTEESKEGSISGSKNEVPPSSSLHQETAAVSSSKEVPEAHSQFTAPLAQEEDSVVQGDVAQESKNKRDEGIEEKENIPKSQDPEVRELQRIHESKLEKEKTVNDSGCTTEKTVYSQFTESTKVQESKGPAVDPFANSSQTIFPPFQKPWHEENLSFSDPQKPTYVHNVTVEDSQKMSPKSTSGDLSVTQLSDEKSNESIELKDELQKEIETNEPLAAEKIEPLVAEVNEPSVAEDNEPLIAEDNEPLVEEDNEPLVEEDNEPLVAEMPCELEETLAKGVVCDTDKDEDHDYQREEVADAVIKIQAGVRGYLTRKALKENKRNYDSDEAAHQNDIENDVLSTDVRLTQSVKETFNESFGDVENPSLQDVGENDAATKIQAMYRGYRTRKHLDDVRSPSPNLQLDSSGIEEEIGDLDSPEPDRVSPRFPVTVTENIILSQKIVFTSPSSPSTEKQSAVLSHTDGANEGSKESTEKSLASDFTETFIEMMHTAVDDEVVHEMEEEDQMQAATKIQAAFRGYKVRKDKRSDTKCPEATFGCVEGSSALTEHSNLLLQDSDKTKMPTESSSMDDVMAKKADYISNEKQENNRGDKQFPSGLEYLPSNPEIDDEEIPDLYGENAEHDFTETDEIQWQSSDIYVKSDSHFPSQTGADKERNSLEQELDPSASETSESDHFAKPQ